MAFPVNIFEGCTGLFICYARWLNTITFGAFWSMFTVAFGLMLFMVSFRFGSTRSFGYATIGCVFLYVYLLFTQLIPWWFASIIFLVGGLGLVFLRLNER